jgi:hypothetical protein
VSNGAEVDSSLALAGVRNEPSQSDTMSKSDTTNSIEQAQIHATIESLLVSFAAFQSVLSGGSTHSREDITQLNKFVAFLERKWYTSESDES